MPEKYPEYTRHGHPIPDANDIAGQRPKYVARCGDPKCADDIRINFAGGLQRSLRVRADRIGAGDE